MKKYISPIAKNIIIDAEAALLSNSDTLQKKSLGDEDFADEDLEVLSNRKRKSIWEE